VQYVPLAILIFDAPRVCVEIDDIIDVTNNSLIGILQPRLMSKTFFTKNPKLLIKSPMYKP